MEEKDIYVKVKKVVGQLSDILHRREPEDLTELKEWLDQNGEAGEVVEMLMDDSRLAKAIDSYRSCDKENARILLRKKISGYKRHRRAILWSSVAATVVLLIGASLFVRYSMSLPAKYPLAVCPPSLTSPTLITADGENIDLSNISGDSVLYFSSGNLSANRTDTTGGEGGLNLLIVPRQCNYQITLCDGSIVHLNAESRLEYPAQFTGKERRVRLRGEGYFEVKHDGRPFLVEVQQVYIRVYGTKFNVNAYEPDEVKTVLVEGKVGVSLKSIPGEEQILKPSQLSRINLLTMKQEVVNTDVEKYTSWVTGFFRYDNDRLEELIKDMNRWYDIDFFFTSQELKDIRISASINKDASLEDVISMIQTTAKIKINHAERRYFITR